MNALLATLKRFILKWNELLTIPLGVAMFALSPRIIRWFDPTAGAYDPAVLQKPFYALAVFFILLGGTRVAMKLHFPRMESWMDNIFGHLFGRNSQLTEWQKALLSVSILLVFLFCLTQLVRSI